MSDTNTSNGAARQPSESKSISSSTTANSFTSTVAPYSTRSSKRKAFVENPTLSSPPSKRTRTAGVFLPEVLPEVLPESSLEDSEVAKAREVTKNSETPEIPENSKIPKVSESSSPSNTITANVEVEDEVIAAPPAMSFRGGRGGRGGRGRGRGRGRGGRGGIGASSKAKAAKKPAVASTFVRGRGNGRVKKSDNARIQSLYHRKQVLRAHFRALAQVQRNALLTIASKSLDLMVADPTAHTLLPEYQEVQDGLSTQYAKTISIFDQRLKLDIECAKKTLEYAEYYEGEVYKNRVQEEEDKIIYGMVGDDEKFLRRTSGVFDKNKLPNELMHFRIVEPDAPWVHPRKIYDPLVVVPTKGKRKNDAKDEIVPEAGATPKGAKTPKGGKGKGKKPGLVVDTSFAELPQPEESHTARPKTSLYQPSLAPALGDELEISLAPTPVASPSPLDPTNSVTEKWPADEYGVSFPNEKRGKEGFLAMNRMVLDPCVEFEEIEIGSRRHHQKHYQNRDSEYLGCDNFQQPKKFHFDKVVSGWDAATLSTEDFDQETIKEYGLHPRTGLPLKGIRNPSPERETDWTEPIPEMTPLTLVVDEDKTLRENIEINLREATRIQASRSWMVRKEHQWDLLDRNSEQSRQSAMGRFLQNIGEACPASPHPLSISEELHDEPDEISQDLLHAADLAQKDLATAPKTPVPPRRSRGYDPVRDTGISPQQERPAEKLSALADAAEFQRGRAQSIPQQQLTRPPQQMLPPPQQPMGPPPRPLHLPSPHRYPPQHSPPRSQRRLLPREPALRDPVPWPFNSYQPPPRQ